MKIVIIKSEQFICIEDYSKYEDVVSIFSEICERIDEQCVAVFSVFWASLDSRFNKLDFKYDFTSIALELEELLQYLKNGKGKFELNFYELDRIIEFSFNQGRLEFRIFSSGEDSVSYQDLMNASDLVKMIENVISTFNIILRDYFPKAFNIFLREEYLFMAKESKMD